MSYYPSKWSLDVRLFIYVRAQSVTNHHHRHHVRSSSFELLNQTILCCAGRPASRARATRGIRNASRRRGRSWYAWLLYVHRVFHASALERELSAWKLQLQVFHLPNAEYLREIQIFLKELWVVDKFWLLFFSFGLCSVVNFNFYSTTELVQ